MNKLIQKRLLTFLQTRWGMTLFFICTTFLLISLLSFFHSSTPIPHFDDNLLNVDQREVLSAPPIDVVYTWVNGSDTTLIKDLEFFKTLLTPPSTLPSNKSADSSTSNRYRDNEEFRYSLRSLWKYAPWIRRVWLVTRGHVPAWLNVQHPRIGIITHDMLFPNKSHLPTFSSPAIETHLHRIPGLAEHFIYFNDDVMLGNYVYPDDFLSYGRGQKVFLSWAVPNCATSCPDAWLGDKYCDAACNVAECNFDMGDCVNKTAPDNRYGNWDSTRASGGASSSKRYCASGCPNNWVGDKVCDRSCKNADCAFDGGDCGAEIMSTLPGFTLTKYHATHGFDTAYDTVALYVNLTDYQGNIIEASQDSPNVVRSAIVTQKLRLLTFIFYRESDIVSEESAAAAASSTGATAPAQTNTDTDTMTLPDLLAHNNQTKQHEQPIDINAKRTINVYLLFDNNGTLSNVTFSIRRSMYEAPKPNTGVDPDEMFAEYNALREQQEKSGEEPVPPKPTQANTDAASSNQKSADKDAILNSQAEAAADRILARDDDSSAPSRRLLSFESLVSKLKSFVAPSSPADNRADSPSSFQPERGYSHTSAYSSSPSAASSYSHLASSYSAPSPSPLYSSWRDMNVYVDGVPASSDRHGGIRLREGGDGLWLNEREETQEQQPTVLSINDMMDSIPSASSTFSPSEPFVTYGWSSSDYDLAHLITVKKKKELWLMERESAKQTYFNAFKHQAEDKKRLKQSLEFRASFGERDDLPQDGSLTARLLSATKYTVSSEPVWPWELNVAAPDLFETWEWINQIQNNQHNQHAHHTHHHEHRTHIQVEDDDMGFNSQNSNMFGTFPSPNDNRQNPSSTSSSSSDSSDSSPPSVAPLHGPRRHLMDVYGDSLRFVNNLYTNAFGKEARKAPAHMPHMIDRRIQEELQARWPELFDATSSHRFRHSHDMQFAFSYFYYLMNVPREFSLPQVWQEHLDLNGDGLLDLSELRHLVLWLTSNKNLKSGTINKDLHTITERLVNVTRLLKYKDEYYFDYDVIANSGDLLDLIREKAQTYKKYRYELGSLDDVEFYMVPDNTTKVIKRLDEIRIKMPKFVCLNDDMNKTHDPPIETVQALHEFYMNYFPLPCPFENPVDSPNDFQYYHEYLQQQSSIFYQLTSHHTRERLQRVIPLAFILTLVLYWCYHSKWWRATQLWILKHLLHHEHQRTSSIV